VNKAMEKDTETDDGGVVHLDCELKLHWRLETEAKFSALSCNILQWSDPSSKEPCPLFNKH
jgi:hypothetical protein